MIGCLDGHGMNPEQDDDECESANDGLFHAEI